MIANLPESVAADSLVTLTAGIMVLAALGYLVAARLRPPAWQRAAWQVVLLAIAGLTAAELAGVSSCLRHLSHLVTASRRDDAASGRASVSAAMRAAGETVAAPDTHDLTAVASGRRRESSHPAASGDGTRSVPATLAGHVGESLRDSRWPLGERRPRADDTFDDDSASESKEGAAAAAMAVDRSDRISGWLAWAARWFVLLWGVGVAMLALWRAGVGGLLQWRFARRLRPLHDDALAWSVYVISRRLGLRRPVRLCEGASIASPEAWGVVRPVIALPPGFAEDFRPDEQQAMLAHELAHLRGADPLWQRLADWLAVILWWHPAVWWARRQWRSASEAAADEASLVVDGGPELLAECLVQMGGRVSGARPLGWVGMRGVGMRGVGMSGGFRSHLGRRVERLLSLGQERWRPPGRLFWCKSLIPVAAVAAAIVGTSWARSETSYQGETDMRMVKHYWRQSVLGVAVLTTLSATDRALANTPAPDRPAAVAADPEQPGEPKAAAPDRAPDRDPGPDAKREGDRPKEGGDRPPPRRREGDRPKEKEGDRPREGGDEPRPQSPREGDRAGERGGERGGPGDGDLERQLRHLKAAADNLEAAGLRDEAERVRRQIKERADRRGGERGGDRPQPGPGRPDGERPRGGDRPGDFRPGEDRFGPDLMRVIQRLQDEVSQLRREVAEMRRMMPRGGRPEDGPGDGRRDEFRREGGGPKGRPGPGADGPPKRDFRPEGPDGDRPPPKRDREGGEGAPPPKEQ